MSKRTGTAFRWSKKNRNGVPVRSGSKRNLFTRQLQPITWYRLNAWLLRRPNAYYARLRVYYVTENNYHTLRPIFINLLFYFIYADGCLHIWNIINLMLQKLFILFHFIYFMLDVRTALLPSIPPLNPSSPTNSNRIWAMMIVWRLRVKITRSAACCVVCDSCA